MQDEQRLLDAGASFSSLSAYRLPISRGPVNRVVAVGYGKAYFVTLDDHLVAVDATNGRVLWQKSVANPGGIAPISTSRVTPAAFPAAKDNTDAPNTSGLRLTPVIY